MAFTPTNYLRNTSGTLLRDQRHASELFNQQQFRLAPKHKFLFHVAFGINPQTLKNPLIVNAHGKEINMLVKAVDLPSFTVQTELLNQYNRKKVVQNQHKPGDISIKFHDDNMGLINQLWQNYYSYYYADSTTAVIPGAYSRNATRAFSSIPAAYGFDAGSTVPFFSYIKIYQMARHEFVCYQLVNPIITSFNHNKLSYSEVGPNDFDMKVQCEAVSYSVGAVDTDNPEGFGVAHYDAFPSPLQASGDMSKSEGGPSFVSTLDRTGLAAGALSNALAQVNTYQNSQESSSPLSDAAGFLGAAAGVAGVIGIGANLLDKFSDSAGGLSDFSFPGASDIGDALSSAGDAISDAASGVGNSIRGLFS
jgi:hypothetical protein